MNEGVDYQFLHTSAGGVTELAQYLTPGLVHYFKYQAENDIGLLSEFSTEYTMLPGTLPSAPAIAP